MTISISKYVSITSGVIGATTVAARELIGRLFTSNHLIPTNAILEFTSADDVGLYFGFDSFEYLRAAFYFGWVSKSATRAKKISFARWVNADVPPEIFGFEKDYSVSDFVGISNGSFNMVDGNTVNAVTGVDFSSVTSLADVATVLQTAIQAIGTGYYTAATVTYDAVNKRFDFVGGVTGTTAAISVTANNAGTSIYNIIGWGTGAIYSAGAVAQSITSILTSSTNISNNFGSFLFVDQLDLTEATEAATWLATKNYEFMFMYGQDVDTYDPVDYPLRPKAGTGVTATNSIDTQFPEQAPMMILAATNYAKPNSTKNYMYQRFSELSPLLFNDLLLDDAQATILDTNRINYYGATQYAGNLIAFYQDGVLMGGANDAADMNTYANEIWLKSTAEVELLNFMLAVEEVPANAAGRASLLNVLQTRVVNPALFNGVISVGKTLNENQIAAISEITNDDLAWHQVQNAGYWLDVVIVQRVVAEALRYEADYTLVYSKDDTVRKVTGTHALV